MLLYLLAKMNFTIYNTVLLFCLNCCLHRNWLEKQPVFNCVAL